MRRGFVLAHQAALNVNPPSLETAQRIGEFETARTDGRAEKFVELEFRAAGRQRRERVGAAAGSGGGLRCRGGRRGLPGNAPDQIGACMLPIREFNVVRNDRVSSQQESTNQKASPTVQTLHHLIQFQRAGEVSPVALRTKDAHATTPDDPVSVCVRKCSGLENSSEAPGNPATD